MRKKDNFLMKGLSFLIKEVICSIAEELKMIEDEELVESDGTGGEHDEEHKDTASSTKITLSQIARVNKHNTAAQPRDPRNPE